MCAAVDRVQVRYRHGCDVRRSGSITDQVNHGRDVSRSVQVRYRHGRDVRRSVQVRCASVFRVHQARKSTSQGMSLVKKIQHYCFVFVARDFLCWLFLVVLKISRMDRVRNEELCRTTGTERELTSRMN